MDTVRRDDASLVRGVRAGDTGLFRELVDRHAAAVFRIVRAAVRQSADAEAPDLRLRVARFYREVGRPGRAIHELRLVRGDPTIERRARVDEMECALLLGRPSEVVEAARDLRFAPGEDGLRARAGNALGDALLRLGNPAGALRAYLGEAFAGEETRR
jgi:hypothetical protein